MCNGTSGAFMRLLFFYPLLLAFPAFSLSSLPSLPSEQLTPGGIAIVNVGKNDTSKGIPDVRFKKKRITVIEQEDNYVAIIGIPLSAKSGAHAIIRKDTKQQFSFIVKKKHYSESRVNGITKDKVNPSKKSLDRIAKERPLKWNAKNVYSKNRVPNFAFVLPIKKTDMKHLGDERFSTPYGRKRFFNNQPRSPHRGMDIRGAEGTPIYAPADGVVTQAQDFFFSGNCVFLNHGRGLVSLYAHMSKIAVKPGQEVKQGDLLGLVGSTGRVSGPHLHWSVGLNGEWVDPALFVNQADRPSKN